ncbi:MAG TPA: hypothetical protein VEZ14_14100 [Dehalococcoidia bacterium]|nr:hypothetical protein [Dehalococcoidia bacterium]
MLAVALSLVLIVSTSLLLYQFWTHALGGESAGTDDAPVRALTNETAAPAFRTDTAA